jgi:NADH dehydrogenase (ubiquinone) 1 beta subcomplex subunit 9
MSAVTSSANRARVASLYKRSLQLARDWAVHREQWFEEAGQIRRQFEANKQVSNPRLVDELLRKGEETLEKNKHPDPYISTPLLLRHGELLRVGC